MERWFLEGFLGQGKVLGQLPLTSFPFKVGRQEGLSFSVSRLDVSRIHAELDCIEGHIIVRDLDSTNGTYVNGEKLRNALILNDGDVIHFANLELRLVKQTNPSVDTSKTLIGLDTMSENPLTESRELQQMLEEGAVTALFQPIVEAGDGRIYGYEILGRGQHPSLPADPNPLFRIADSVGKAVELSELFRQQGLGAAANFPAQYKYFFNIHPAELASMPRFLANMRGVRDHQPDLHLVVEFHEQAVSDLSEMKRVGGELAEMGIELAYDDFGAGQARLLELVEVPVSYLKFDISLIRDVDKAPDTRREMISLLIDLARKMEIATVAEGLNRDSEVEVCSALGFDYLQGYYFGRPGPVVLND